MSQRGYEDRSPSATLIFMDTGQIQWLAGLLEGEGNFALKKQETRRNGNVWVRYHLLVQMSMTDRDVVKRAWEVSGGCGRIYKKKPPVSHPHHKLQHSWQVVTNEEAYAIMVAVYPFMGERRKRAIEEAIRKWRDIPIKRHRDRCPQGHEYTEENTAIDGQGYRRCRQCNRDRSKKNKNRKEVT